MEGEIVDWLEKLEEDVGVAGGVGISTTTVKRWVLTRT
jgi:hypothetical protein